MLSSTLLLIVVPWGLFFFFESVNPNVGRKATNDRTVMSTLPALDRLGAACFMSVTSRTAGFNSVEMDSDSLSTASSFLLMILMFIGGSPASTAGGVKTVAIAVLVLGVINTMRQRGEVEAFGRTIPSAIVRRSAAVVLLLSGVVATTTLILSLTESATLQEILFEVISACGTVGLSMGITSHLTLLGKIAIMLAMFAGRLGPLTVMIALAGGSAGAKYDYPEEQVTIG